MVANETDVTATMENVTAPLEPEILKRRNSTKGRSLLSFFAKITPTPLFLLICAGNSG